MVTIVYHDDLKEVQGDPVLNALVTAPHAAAPFDRIEWWQGLARYCGISPLLAVAADGDKRAVLPLARKGREIQALANWYSFRAASLFSPDARKTEMLGQLAASLSQCGSRLNLAPLSDDDGQVTDLVASLRKAGWFVIVEQCDVNHVLNVGGRSFAEYLSGRPGALRSTLKRKAGKVQVELFEHFDQAAWADYEAIYAQSWKPQEGSPEFLRAFAEQEGAAGRLRMAIARHDGRAIAAQLWTVEGTTAFIHKLAHTEADKNFSAGTTLSAALFERVIDHDKVGMVDFGTGNDGYKRDWMEQVRPRYRLRGWLPLRPGNWFAIAKSALRIMVQRGKRP